MAAEAEAAREARAKIIRAHGEEKATRALKQAADELTHNPNAMQLRYLQTLSSIGNEKNTTIIFPVPVDMISHFVGRNGQKQSSRLSPSSSSLPSESSSQKKSSIPRIQVITDQDVKETEEDTVDDDFLLRRSPSFFWTEQ